MKRLDGTGFNWDVGRRYSRYYCYIYYEKTDPTTGKLLQTTLDGFGDSPEKAISEALLLADGLARDVVL